MTACDRQTCTRWLVLFAYIMVGSVQGLIFITFSSRSATNILRRQPRRFTTDCHQTCLHVQHSFDEATLYYNWTLTGGSSNSSLSNHGNGLDAKQTVSTGGSNETLPFALALLNLHVPVLLPVHVFQADMLLNWGAIMSVILGLPIMWCV